MTLVLVVVGVVVLAVVVVVVIVVVGVVLVVVVGVVLVVVGVVPEVVLVVVLVVFGVVVIVVGAAESVESAVDEKQKTHFRIRHFCLSRVLDSSVIQHSPVWKGQGPDLTLDSKETSRSLMS